LRLFLHADSVRFRTGWFVESVLSAALAVLVIRTRRPLVLSRPSRGLLAATLVVVGATVLLPLIGRLGKVGALAHLFGFAPLPMTFWWALGGLLTLYLVGAELTKRLFYRHQRRYSQPAAQRLRERRTLLVRE
jgi:P-type Mg2+ transporter